MVIMHLPCTCPHEHHTDTHSYDIWMAGGSISPNEDSRKIKQDESFQSRRGWGQTPLDENASNHYKTINNSQPFMPLRRSNVA